MSNNGLPISNPVQPIVNSLQVALRDNGKAKIEEDPQSYFTYLGAKTHLENSLKLLLSLNEKGLIAKDESSQQEVDLLIEQLKILDQYEWI